MSPYNVSPKCIIKMFHQNVPSECLIHIVPFGKFHRIGGAPPETYPNVNFMPLKRCLATENVLTALLGNEVWSKFFMLIVTGAQHCCA